MSLTRAELLRRGFVAGVLLTFGELAEVAEAQGVEPPGVSLDEHLGYWRDGRLTWWGPAPNFFEHEWQLAEGEGDAHRRRAEESILNIGGSYIFNGLVL